VVAVEPVEPEPVEAPITVTAEWDAAQGKMVATLDVKAADVTVWREIGDRTSTFVPRRGITQRLFNGSAGEVFTLRLGDEHGPVLVQETVPGD
jgi:hypothetical protein